MGDLGHEYSVHNGANRSKTGKLIYSCAAFGSWLVIYFLVKLHGELSPFLNLIIPTIVTATLFIVFYYIFNKWVWKIGLLYHFLKFPNISGEWECMGVSDYEEDTEKSEMKAKGSRWQGTVTIVQSWDKVHIRLETQYSESESLSVAIVHNEMGENKVLYSYENKPKDENHPQLKKHRGFVELTLHADNKTATANYYNLAGRRTIGTMTWTKTK